MNKKLLTWTIVLVMPLYGMVACQQSKGNKEAGDEGKSESVLDPSQLGKFEFETSEYDFGTVNEGDVVEYTYKFKNIGEAPLLIEDAKSTCGCTVPEPPKEPIAPGETGELLVKFNTSHKTNSQQKVISIYANTDPAITKVTLKGFVEPKTTEQ